jgi:hypothetical protein
VNGNNAQTFAFALIAQLRNLREVGFRSFGTDRPEMNKCRVTLRFQAFRFP